MQDPITDEGNPITDLDNEFYTRKPGEKQPPRLRDGESPPGPARKSNMAVGQRGSAMYDYAMGGLFDFLGWCTR